MITFTRRQAQQLRAVIRKTVYGRCRPNPTLPVSFTVSGDRLRVRVATDTVAVEYNVSYDGELDELTIPLKLLTDCAVRSDDAVQVERSGSGEILACWDEDAVPQMARYVAAEPQESFPPIPTETATNPPSLITALRDAVNTTDAEAARFALDHVQFRGSTGEIVATDGRQLLVQAGFEFPWEQDVLVPRNLVFGCTELQSGSPVRIGMCEDWVCVQLDCWSFFLKVPEETPFPDVHRCVPEEHGAIAALQFGERDAEFLARSLKSLPRDDDFNKPVTLDLNGSVAIRAASSEQANPVEIVLPDSRWKGTEVRLQTSSSYLERALRLGFRTLHIFAANQPVLCADAHRRYVWAVLDPESAVKPTAQAVRIEPPCRNRPRPRQRRRTQSRMQHAEAPLAPATES